MRSFKYIITDNSKTIIGVSLIDEIKEADITHAIRNQSCGAGAELATPADKPCSGISAAKLGANSEHYVAYL